MLQRRPAVAFACAAMAGQREALRAVERYHLENKVTLLPHLPQTDLWGLFARAAVTVSVSQHDGTPNTLLEAMAFGALPVAGDIESIREWITPGVNGLLVEPSKPHALAEAVLLALDSPDLRARAAGINANLVAERASAGMVREKLHIFYEGVAASRGIPV
ncbi:MAG: glycosyltransferase [Chloroflexi bacterium]|nr:MAG: glycosyltransferase [Chloroflexota bacterium]